MDSLDLTPNLIQEFQCRVTHILSIGGDALTSYMMKKQTTQGQIRKCATNCERPTSMVGVPSLMEKIPNHLGNESMCDFEHITLNPAMREQREAQWQAQR